MTTKLSRYCEGIMEAAWLAAVIVVPVFFNIYSSRIFEPDKLALLRSLALIILGAWLVKIVDEGGVLREKNVPWHKAIWQVPIVPQVVLLAIIYIIATIFSVTPRVSLWGSYQRLQGTYTTLSYMVIFAAIVGNLRRHKQVERLLTATIIASLPVGLYGILQRYEIDPVPWGGNVVRRIASNMGNSIFIAAYLIMAFPITVGRIIDSFTAILKETEGLGTHILRGTIYVFVAAIQIIAIYLSGSRGPMLGLLAGSFFLFLILSLYWRKRWLTISVVALAILGVISLVLLNIPNGPLESIRNAPWVGRFSQMLDTGQRTSQVRILIWEGASELVSPHEPLEYPDGGKDSYNFLRPAIGYGPESMYVAYNPFYPSELGNIEARNASPDRSHNETWDALVITGALGLLFYLSLFISIFYYSLKWLGLIDSPKKRNLFFALVLGGGGLGTALGIYFGGIQFFGIGLPFGIVAGLILYLPLIALFSRYEPPQTEGGRIRALVLMILLASIVAHFVEIHFGIAIAATRTYFWVYTALLLVVGFVMTEKGVYGTLSKHSQESAPEMPEDKAKSNRAPSRKKRARQNSRGRLQRGIERSGAIVGGLVTGILMMTLGYDFITNSNQNSSVTDIVWTSLTRLPNKEFAVSYGILALMLTPLVIAILAFFGEEAKSSKNITWKSFPLVALSVAGGIALLFWLTHASGLASLTRKPEGVEGLEHLILQAGKIEGLLTKYYVFLFFLILLLARFLPEKWPPKPTGQSGRGILAVPVAFILVLYLISATNLRIIHADISFKIAEPYSRGSTVNEWEAAISLYQRATDHAPAEDHYYLFLGRGYLELARLLQPEDPAASEQWMAQAEEDLKFAQSINPLNTDHTANLARLFSFWTSLTQNSTQRQQHAETSSDYYARAVTLSPNNAVIWNEWAILYMRLLGNVEKGIETLEHSSAVDPTYGGTHKILADYYLLQGRQTQDNPSQKSQHFNQAIFHYQQAISATVKFSERQIKYDYITALGNVYAELAQYEDAIKTYEEAIPYAKKNQKWRVENIIAQVYVQLQDYENALVYAENALEHAPTKKQKEQVQQLIALIQQQSP